ncbi:MAG: glycosyltransferase family 4 protein [Bacteroidales bacterium]|nr:glycosyltransferase family 4 protein [Bacteroidales bacterium]
MRIAFITFGDIHDMNNWSGAVNAMYRVAGNASKDIVIIDNIEKCYNWFVVKWFKILEKIRRRSFQINRIPINLKRVARHIDHVLNHSDVDLLFSTSSLPFSYLKSDIPKVCWTDATFRLLVDYYPDYMKLTNKTIERGNKTERLSLENVSMILYASDWAAKSAINDYKINAGKIRIIPFGPNIQSSLNHQQINEVIEARVRDETIKLLSIGVDWKRKGFDLTLSIAREIAERGHKIELSIAGAHHLVTAEPNFTYHNYGRLKKTNPRDYEMLIRLYTESHFFVLPSSAECAGIVFAEASSYALPSVTRNTGGIPTMVENGKNGIVFDFNAPAVEYADKIIEIFTHKESYKNLCISSFDKYKQDLNWTRASELFTRYALEIRQKKSATVEL